MPRTCLYTLPTVFGRRSYAFRAGSHSSAPRPCVYRAHICRKTHARFFRIYCRNIFVFHRLLSNLLAPVLVSTLGAYATTRYDYYAHRQHLNRATSFRPIICYGTVFVPISNSSRKTFQISNLVVSTPAVYKQLSIDF